MRKKNQLQLVNCFLVLCIISLPALGAQKNLSRTALRDAPPEAWSEEIGRLYPDQNAMLRYLYPYAVSSNKYAQLAFSRLLIIAPEYVKPINGCNSSCLFKKSTMWIRKLKFDRNVEISNDAKDLIKNYSTRNGPFLFK
jgi:hypothetical protein